MGNNASANTRFDKNEIKAIKAEFKAEDKDGSGELDFEEFKGVMSAHMTDATEETLQQLFNTFDSDSSGNVSLKELMTGLDMMGNGTAEEKLGFMFDTYDDDNSGDLSTDEVQGIVAQMKTCAEALGRDPNQAESFLQGIISKLDEDGDGMITRAEWVEVGLKTPSLLLLLGADDSY